MIETPLPILAKTPVLGLAVHVGRSGLCIGDRAEVFVTAEGEVSIWANIRSRYLGLLPCQRDARLGHLGPVAARILAPALDKGHPLRVRIVGITPEHLCGAGGPEIHVSVWGVPMRARAARAPQPGGA